MSPIAAALAMPTRAPRQRPVAMVPSPRRPTRVRAAGSGALLDLFEVFPDLPRPPRPANRRATLSSSLGLRLRRYT
jgi:hypothetical protein